MQLSSPRFVTTLIDGHLVVSNHLVLQITLEQITFVISQLKCGQETYQKGCWGEGQMLFKSSVCSISAVSQVILSLYSSVTSVGALKM